MSQNVVLYDGNEPDQENDKQIIVSENDNKKRKLFSESESVDMQSNEENQLVLLEGTDSHKSNK